MLSKQSTQTRDPFPSYQVIADHPRDAAVVRGLFAITEGLVGRGYRSSLRCASPLMSDGDMRVIFEDGSLFAFPARDPYWSRLATTRFSYEPEIAYLLMKLKNTNYTFIDGGANIGFWSILASSLSFGSKRTIAVEASRETLLLLERNCALNANRFQISPRALYNRDDAELGFSSGHHTVRHLTSEMQSEVVRTITLDTLIENAGISTAEKLVIKLDVEGAEAEALAGGRRRVLCGDTLLVYEDHGSDLAHSISSHLRQDIGLEIGYIDERGHVMAIHDAHAITKLKSHRFVGYNFLACRAGSHFYDLLWPRGG